MNNQTIKTEKEIPQPNWESVRTIYKKLSDEFSVLTDSYNIELRKDTKNHLDHLIIVIDEVDQCIDELEDKSLRDSITTSLISFLGNNDQQWFHPNVSEVMIEQIEIIKIIIIKENIEQEFIAAAESIFRVTELKRHTDSVDKFIDFLIIEGQSTAKLPLSFLKIDSKERFGIFFSRLCMIMGVVDLVFDAKQDFKNGYIKIEPSFKLYYKLFRIIVGEGTKILIDFPKKIKFLIYCLKFTVILMKE